MKDARSPIYTIVIADDWEGLYVDDDLLLEGHSLRVEDVLLALGHEVHGGTVNEAWMNEEQRLPKLLTKVVFE